MGNLWLKEEIDIIKDNYKTMDDEELTKIISRHSLSSIATKRKEIGCTRSNRKYEFDDVIKEFGKTQYILLSDASEYTNAGGNTLRYICPIHKDKGEQKISLGHLQSGRGCYYCGRERTVQAERMNKQELNIVCRKTCEQKGFIFIDAERVNGILYIDFVCPKHKHAGVQRMRKGGMERANVVGCPYCLDLKKYKMSKGEQRVKEVLEKYNIRYIPQYKFWDCKGQRILAFDFYLTDLHRCIEYDGEHHYFPVTYFSVSKKTAYKHHLTTIKNDKIKNKYCRNNNIPLLRIPYYESDNIEEIILDFIWKGK